MVPLVGVSTFLTETIPPMGERSICIRTSDGRAKTSGSSPDAPSRSSNGVGRIDSAVAAVSERNRPMESGQCAAPGVDF